MSPAASSSSSPSRSPAWLTATGAPSDINPEFAALARDRLKPGGILYVGHSENFTEHRDLVDLVGKTTYRRKGDAA